MPSLFTISVGSWKTIMNIDVVNVNLSIFRSIPRFTNLSAVIAPNPFIESLLMESAPSFLTKTKNKLGIFFRDAFFTINEKVILHRTFVDVSAEFVKSFAQFALYKQPVFLIEGAVNSLKAFAGSPYRPEDFFCEINGWRQFTYGEINIAQFFSTCLEKYPTQSLKFSSYDSMRVSIIETPLGKIGSVSEGNADRGTRKVNLYYRHNDITKEALNDFLITEFLAALNSLCFSISYHGSEMYAIGDNLTISAEDFTALPSKLATEYVEYIKECLQLGINRSFLFHGSPGSGKTSAAKTIFKELGFRTLKFRYAENYDFNIFKLIIQTFKVEAVMIDDFDYIEDATELLEFLEFLKKEVKVVIAIANNLNGFSPAIIRADRIDQLVEINCLEEKAVRELMGAKLYKYYGAKIKKWPVAFIQEFCRRDTIGKEPLKQVYTELNQRVLAQSGEGDLDTN